jgi:hypothetical protein
MEIILLFCYIVSPARKNDRIWREKSIGKVFCSQIFCFLYPDVVFEKPPVVTVLGEKR